MAEVGPENSGFVNVELLGQTEGGFSMLSSNVGPNSGPESAIVAPDHPVKPVNDEARRRARQSHTHKIQWPHHTEETSK